MEKNLRRCVGCNEMISKKKLIRVVRIDKKYLIDKVYKSDGRGAYICKNEKCIKKAEKSRGLERSFKSKIPNEIYSKINVEVVKNGE